MKTLIFLTAILISSGLIFIKYNSNKINRDEYKSVSAGGIRIKEKWDLPEELKEVSGISFLGNEKFACVQDEEGTVFIYNLRSGKIEKKIAFTPAGDFEGITV